MAGRSVTAALALAAFVVAQPAVASPSSPDFGVTLVGPMLIGTLYQYDYVLQNDQLSTRLNEIVIPETAPGSLTRESAFPANWSVTETTTPTLISGATLPSIPGHKVADYLVLQTSDPLASIASQSFTSFAFFSPYGTDTGASFLGGFTDNSYQLQDAPVPIAAEKQAVLEPASASLLVAGLAALVGARRRRR